MTAVTDIDRELSSPTQFIVRRNQSLSWRGNKLFIYFIAVVSLGIGGMFAIKGLWLILPFAGLEVLALAICLFLVCLRCGDQEVITIENERVVVEKGRQKPNEVWQFERAWINLQLVNSPLPNHPSKLLIRSKDKETEIGKNLTNDERKSLAKSLVKALKVTLINS